MGNNSSSKNITDDTVYGNLYKQFKSNYGGEINTVSTPDITVGSSEFVKPILKRYENVSETVIPVVSGGTYGIKTQQNKYDEDSDLDLEEMNDFDEVFARGGQPTDGITSETSPATKSELNGANLSATSSIQPKNHVLSATSDNHMSSSKNIIVSPTSIDDKMIGGHSSAGGNTSPYVDISLASVSTVRDGDFLPQIGKSQDTKINERVSSNTCVGCSISTDTDMKGGCGGGCVGGKKSDSEEINILSFSSVSGSDYYANMQREHRYT